MKHLIINPLLSWSFNMYQLHIPLCYVVIIFMEICVKVIIYGNLQTLEKPKLLIGLHWINHHIVINSPSELLH